MQRGITLSLDLRNSGGFDDRQFVHIPLDTVWLLAIYRPDVVISTEMGVRSFGAIIYRMIRPKTRLVLWLNLSERTEQERDRVRAGLRKLIVRFADGFFINGASGNRYLNGLGIKNNRIFRLPYSTDAKTFGSDPVFRSEREGKRLLYVGQLIARKGVVPFVKLLLRWVEDHPAEKLEITLVGDGEERPALESLQQHSEQLSVRIIGNAAYGDLPFYYQNHGILAFPTLADEWGIVVNEALVSGLPVLGSIHSQAVQEMVETGVTGWAYDPEKPRDALEMLDRALSTPAIELESMRKAGRERALKYAPEALIENVIDGLCGSNASHP